MLPNEALSKGDIDLNAFQHKPYLDQQIKDRGYKLVPVGNTFVYPDRRLPKKIKSLDELKDGSQIALPNDPTNLGRSLLLLQESRPDQTERRRWLAADRAGRDREPEKPEAG